MTWDFLKWVMRRCPGLIGIKRGIEEPSFCHKVKTIFNTGQRFQPGFNQDRSPTVLVQIQTWGIMRFGLETRDGAMIKILFSFALVFCLAFSAVAQEESRQMYTWTDENGVVHFTDERPPGQVVTEIDIPASAAQPVSNLPQGEGPADNEAGSSEQLSLADQRREEMAARREEILAAREKNAKICAEKRNEIARLEPNRRVYFTNEQGEVERMDDVVRTNKVAEDKAYIDANCQ